MDRDAWTRPGSFEVAPGVRRIVCPLPQDGLRAVNVYAIDDGDGVALMDTGWNHPDIVTALTAALGSFERITAIICTHSHYDHYGLAGKLREWSGAPVLLGSDELPNLSGVLDADGYARSSALARERMTLHGAGSLLAASDGNYERVLARGPWVLPDRELADGERIELRTRVLEAKLTPGHTRGHLMFLDREAGLVFGGDHLLPHITPSLGFESFGDEKALERFLASLADIRDLPARHVLPGHGPVFDDLRGRVTGARGPPRRAPAGLSRRAGRHQDRVRRRPATHVDPPRAPVRRTEPLQPDARGERDDHAPRAARRPRRAAPRTQRRAAALRPSVLIWTGVRPSVIVSRRVAAPAAGVCRIHFTWSEVACSTPANAPTRPSPRTAPLPQCLQSTASRAQHAAHRCDARRTRINPSGD